MLIQKPFYIAVLVLTLLLSACAVTDKQPAPPLQTGAEQLSLYLPLLKDKKVGLLVNQTSVIGQQHVVDVLLQHDVNIVAIFAPEHGFRGDHDAGATVNSGTDSKTGLPVLSLYGPNKKPDPSQLSDIDVLIFDIQDVGVRYYTYISSMHYLMEAAAEADKAFIVLDRPNPNGRYLDGPVLDLTFQSFVGMHPIPLLHGMTVGELAQMIKGEGWINNADTLNLTVIPVVHYQRTMSYSLPVRPSPNLPNDKSIELYASLGFFEATPLSIGRGTPYPFQVIGYSKFGLGNFQFTPVATPGAAMNPPLKDVASIGQDLRTATADGLDLSYLINWHQLFAQQQETFFNAPAFMDKLAGTDQLRLQIEQGKTEQQIRAGWQPALQVFEQQRQPYLLYP